MDRSWFNLKERWGYSDDGDWKQGRVLVLLVVRFVGSGPVGHFIKISDLLKLLNLDDEYPTEQIPQNGVAASSGVLIRPSFFR